jgi:predicted membrane protein
VKINESIRLKRSQAIKEKKKRKEVENEEIQETWFGSIIKFIDSRKRPFTYGLSG